MTRDFEFLPVAVATTASVEEQATHFADVIEVEFGHFGAATAGLFRNGAGVLAEGLEAARLSLDGPREVGGRDTRCHAVSLGNEVVPVALATREHEKSARRSKLVVVVAS